MIETLLRYAVSDNVYRPAGENRFDYQEDQIPIQIAEKEMLYRYPDPAEREKLEWRLAFADALLDEPSSDKWILAQLETRLNSTQATPETLNSIIRPYGFKVQSITPAENLFGDGQPAPVILITLQDRENSGGLYAGMRQEEDGSWQLIKIHSLWDFNFGLINLDEPFQLEDRTRDGTEEVVLNPDI